MNEVDELIEFFKNYGTTAIGRWATVNKVWKELYQTQMSISKEQLINEVKNWKYEQWGFTPNEIDKTIEGMINWGFISVSDRLF